MSMVVFSDYGWDVWDVSRKSEMFFRITLIFNEPSIPHFILDTNEINFITKHLKVLLIDAYKYFFPNEPPAQVYEKKKLEELEIDQLINRIEYERAVFHSISIQGVRK